MIRRFAAAILGFVAGMALLATLVDASAHKAGWSGFEGYVSGVCLVAAWWVCMAGGDGDG